jgi:hypothetical protein
MPIQPNPDAVAKFARAHRDSGHAIAVLSSARQLLGVFRFSCPEVVTRQCHIRRNAHHVHDERSWNKAFPPLFPHRYARGLQWTRFLAHFRLQLLSRLAPREAGISCKRPPATGAKTPGGSRPRPTCRRVPGAAVARTPDPAGRARSSPIRRLRVAAEHRSIRSRRRTVRPEKTRPM